MGLTLVYGVRYQSCGNADIPLANNYTLIRLPGLLASPNSVKYSCSVKMLLNNLFPDPKIQRSAQELCSSDYNESVQFPLLWLPSLPKDCYPETLALAAKSLGFGAVLVETPSEIVGLDTSFLWATNEYSAVPVYSIPQTLWENTNMCTEISFDPVVSKYTGDNYVEQLRGIGGTVMIVAFVKIVFCIMTIRSKQATTGRDYNIMYYTICSLELAASLATITHFGVDPFGFFHILSFPVTRSLLFLSINLPVTGTFFTAAVFHKALITLNFKKWQRRFPAIAFFSYYLLSIVLYVINIARITVPFDAYFMLFALNTFYELAFGIYFCYCKNRVFQALQDLKEKMDVFERHDRTRSLVKKSSSGGRTTAPSSRAQSLMSSRLILAAGFMFGFVLFMGVFILLSLSNQFSYGALGLSLLMVNFFGLFQVMSLMNEDSDDSRQDTAEKPEEAEGAVQMEKHIAYDSTSSRHDENVKEQSLIKEPSKDRPLNQPLVSNQEVHQIESAAEKEDRRAILSMLG